MENDEYFFCVYFPVYVLLKYTGYAPYNLHGAKGNRFVTFNKNYAFISAVIHLFASTWLIVASINEDTRYVESQLLIATGIASIYIIRNLFFLSSICLNKYYCRNYIEFMNAMCKLMNKFTKTGIMLKHTNGIKLKQLFLITYGIISTIGQFIILSMMNPTSSWQKFMLSIYLVVTFAEFLHIMHYLTVTTIFVNLTRRIRIWLTNDTNNISYFQTAADEKQVIAVIAYISKIYLELCETYNKFSQCLSLSTLFLLGEYTSATVFTVLTLTYTLEIFDVCRMLIILIHIFIPLALLVKTSVAIQNEIHLLQQSLFRIFIKSNISTKQEINLFMLQMLHVKFETSAAGFFDIDMKMIFSITSVVVQYALILVQSLNNNE